MATRRLALELIGPLVLDCVVLIAGFGAVGLAFANTLANGLIEYGDFNGFEALIMAPALTFMIGGPACVMYWYMRRHTLRHVERVGALIRAEIRARDNR